MVPILKPEDIYKFTNLGDAQISPDGSRVMFVVSQAEKKTDRDLSNIWVVETPGGKPRRLTSSGKDRFPRWSPDGKRFAFVSDRTGKAQIWIMEAKGGEPWLLSTDQAVQSAPVWSPDGKYIVFTAKDFTKGSTWVTYPGAPEWDRKRTEDQARQALSGQKRNEGDGNVGYSAGETGGRVSDVKVITRFCYRFDGIDYFGDLRNHVFIVAVPESPPESSETKGCVRRLTYDDYDHGDPAFSPDGNPDGKYLVITAVRREDTDYVQKQDFWLIEVATGRMIQLMDGQGPCRGARWSPDGKKIAFIGNDRSYGNSTTEALWVLNLEEFLKEFESRGILSTPRPLPMEEALNVTKELDRPVGNPVSSDMRYAAEDRPFAWEDGNTLLFLACDRGTTGLYRATLTEGTTKSGITRLWCDPGRTVSPFDRAGGKMVLQIGSPVETDDLYLFDDDPENSGSSPGLTRLVESNPWLSKINLGACKRFTYKGDKEWDIDGWLVYPAGYERGKKYPTVLFIHGGPHGVYGSSFMFQYQIFASKGYAVVYTNPRGSQSYGQKFAYACVEDWSGSDFKDIMAGVDYVINMGVADPASLFVTGWSYSGFMASWTITQTNRFNAAITGATVANRYSMYGTSDIPFFSEHHCGGLPWEARDRYFERSPISYVTNVETPVMFIHGEGDLRCPISPSEEFYLSLKRLGKTAVFVRYPGEFHGFTWRSHKFDRFEKMLAWFDYYPAN